MIEFSAIKKLHAAEGEIQLDVSLKIKQGEFISLFGSSGAGKTSILRILAGLTSPDKGFISSGSRVWLDTEKKIFIKPQERETGFVFQDYALFPNMTVEENLKFVLPRNAEVKRVRELLELTGLQALSNKKPDTLSGGQKQRVALARALVRQPRLLLLDEALSALDHATRLKLQNDILSIHRHYGLTTIMVSHELSEVYRLSDRIIELEQGKIVKEGSPAVYFRDLEMSGKVQFMGEILEISREDIVYLLKISVGNNIVNVIVTRDEAALLKPGDKVTIASKAFNPIVRKIV